MNRVQHVILVATASLALSGVIHAQGDWQWSDHFGGPGHDWGRIGAVDDAGNVYCFGTYAGAGSIPFYDMYIGGDTLFGSSAGFVSKHDPSGSVVWAMNIECDFSAAVQAMVIDTINEVLILGGFHLGSTTIGSVSLPDSGAFIAKVDLDGTCQAAINIGSTRTDCRGLALDDQGDIYASGTVNDLGGAIIGTDTVDPGTFIAKFENDGTPIWAKELISELQGLYNEPRFSPVALRCHGGQVFVHGRAIQSASSGPFSADTVVVNIADGAGHALLALDTATGVALWMKTLGFSPIGQSAVLRQLMDISTNGDIYCAATVYGDSARFAGDTTLAIPSTFGGISYLAKYSSSGEMVEFRNYGQDLWFTALDVTDDEELLLMGSYEGSSAVGSCTGSDGLFLARLDSTGDCLDITNVANDGLGLAVRQTPDAIFVTCSSPGAPQYGTSVFAEDTVTRYGFEDVLLGKHDKALGVGSLHSMLNTALVIYANPNEGSFRLIIPSEFANERQLQLSVYDASGRLVTEGPLDMGEEHPRTDIYGISPGTYHVTLTNGQQTYHGSMVVE